MQRLFENNVANGEIYYKSIITLSFMEILHRYVVHVWLYRKGLWSFRLIDIMYLISPFSNLFNPDPQTVNLKQRTYKNIHTNNNWIEVKTMRQKSSAADKSSDKICLQVGMGQPFPTYNQSAADNFENIRAKMLKIFLHES